MSGLFRDLEDLLYKGIEKRRAIEDDARILVALATDARLTEREQQAIRRVVTILAEGFKLGKSFFGR